MKKLIKFGIFGLYRGASYCQAVLQNNGVIVAVCDKSEERIASARERIGNSAKAYTDFEEFLNHPGLEAVFLCNYFDQHAPFAVRALEKGIHVLSECTAASTMAECVALMRAAEKSKAVYMLAENYPYMKFNKEMKRVYESGTLGKCLFAEGEYNHPLSPLQRDYIKKLRPYEEHWRNFTPRTYYVTHSLGPLMHITGGLPKRVSAFPVFSPTPSDPLFGHRVGDRAAIIISQNDDGSVYRFTGCSGFGGHENSYRICGVKGQMENLRDGSDQVTIHYNEWDKPEGEEERQTYTPDWNDPDVELIEKSGHGGGDFFVIREFFGCIREGREPFFNAYRSTVMSSVAILAHRSLLEGGTPYDIPDLRDVEQQKLYEGDTLSPFYASDGTPPTLPCCSRPDYTADPATVSDYEKLLAEG